MSTYSFSLVVTCAVAILLIFNLLASRVTLWSMVKTAVLFIIFFALINRQDIMASRHFAGKEIVSVSPAFVLEKKDTVISTHTTVRHRRAGTEYETTAYYLIGEGQTYECSLQDYLRFEIGDKIAREVHEKYFFFDTFGYKNEKLIKM